MVGTAEPDRLMQASGADITREQSAALQTQLNSAQAQPCRPSKPVLHTSAPQPDTNKTRTICPNAANRAGFSTVAPAGVEPTMGESKSPALPLGDGALQKIL